MGKFGWHSGYLKAQNKQSGKVSVTVDGNGDGTASITFPVVLKSIPVIVGSPQESEITATVSFKNITEVSATVVVDGSAKTTGTLSIGWILQDYD